MENITKEEFKEIVELIGEELEDAFNIEFEGSDVEERNDEFSSSFYLDLIYPYSNINLRVLRDFNIVFEREERELIKNFLDDNPELIKKYPELKKNGRVEVSKFHKNLSEDELEDFYNFEIDNSMESTYNIDYDIYTNDEKTKLNIAIYIKDYYGKAIQKILTTTHLSLMERDYKRKIFKEIEYSIDELKNVLIE